MLVTFIWTWKWSGPVLSNNVDSCHYQVQQVFFHTAGWHQNKDYVGGATCWSSNGLFNICKCAIILSIEMTSSRSAVAERSKASVLDRGWGRGFETRSRTSFLLWTISGKTKRNFRKNEERAELSHSSVGDVVGSSSRTEILMRLVKLLRKRRKKRNEKGLRTSNSHKEKVAPSTNIDNINICCWIEKYRL